ncbi:MAG: DUF262 domain-containing protein [Clostridium sp.]|nr:DUF262 domain-containing protein [Clostridium sp.]
MSDINFTPRSVSEFLDADVDEPYIFNIPSFQRGYRWMPKQVEDLLKDLHDFANDDSSNVYYLQPLVVRGEGKKWEVLDGQQRLTTLKLILAALRKYITEGTSEAKVDYQIHYLNRLNLDFSAPKPNANLDSYYVAKADETIKSWIDTKKKEKKSAELELMARTLYGVEKGKAVKFIWYEVEGDDSSDTGAIATFNRLNRGKLKLTPSELIKALLIISAEGAEGGDRDAQTVLSMEWNEIERQFMRDDFFAFINCGNAQYDTRTDLLFNHLVRSKGAQEKDDDFAYRWFQNKYDNKESILDIWERDVKDIYDMLMQWYADPEMYNCIGFLSQCNVKIDHIRDALAKAKAERKKEGGQWRKEDNVLQLKKLIKSQFKPIKNDSKERGKESVPFPEAINLLDYNNNKTYISRILLLFNVETYSKLNLRFPFDRYVDEKWDIEHVDSQTTNPLAKNEDQYNWLKYSAEVVTELADAHSELSSLSDEIKDCLEQGIESPMWKSRYTDLYNRIVNISYIKTDDAVADKDAIGNLTLLDSATNRGYGNALFPYKRKCIVEREKTGAFVPACTRNLFLKYYSGDNGTGAGNSIKWSDSDATAYRKAIRAAIDPIFNLKD